MDRAALYQSRPKPVEGKSLRADLEELSNDDLASLAASALTGYFMYSDLTNAAARRKLIDILSAVLCPDDFYECTCHTRDCVKSHPFMTKAWKL